MNPVNPTATDRSLSVEAPAKINLVLAIVGVRDDGFHELVSLVAPVAFCDTLHVRLHGAGVIGKPHRQSPGGRVLHDGSPVSEDTDETASQIISDAIASATQDVLYCADADVPTDASNLILRAALAFREELANERTVFSGHWEFRLEKRIPVGAGLGGGSSDAAAALDAMNRICGNPLSEQKLYALAARIGSDCPLFLAKAPVVMRGRGDRLTFLGHPARQALNGQRILLFKPSFGINTGWAYGQMKAAQGRMYVAAKAIESSIHRWEDAPKTEALPLFNNMQAVAFDKYLALPALLEQLRATHPGLRCLMSGSGSACFALLDKKTTEEEVAQLKAQIRAAWGASAFCEETTLL